MMAGSAAVILAAGLGKRMRSTLPKPLHPVAGRPMIRYAVNAVREAEADRVVVVVGPGADHLRAALPADVEVVVQTRQLGTGDAVRAARDLLVDDEACRDILVTNGDSPLVTGDLLRHLIARRRATDATMALIVSPADDPRGYGRVLRQPNGQVRAIVEEAAASPTELAIQEVNAGIYCFEAGWLWQQLPELAVSNSGEYYLTDLVELATRSGRLVQSIVAPLTTCAGVNDRIQLADAERVVRDRIRRRLMLAGVTITDPASTYVDADVTIGPDTVILPGTSILGSTQIGSGCRIGPQSYVVDSEIADEVIVLMSVVEKAQIARGARLGPFSHLRPGARLLEGAELGNFAEVKNATIGVGTKMHHFSYVGDAEIGRNVNVAAGTITCNYDGETGLKNWTVVEDGALLGSDTLLIAPVRVGEDAVTAAGAVVTRDVDPAMVVAGVPARPNRPRRRRSDA
jgi:bifunctional UDP-N-acetylglucosamine pyrophosphorylase / glucosamine-1-phosphate N-acetyltransferase